MARKQVDPSEILETYASHRPTGFDARGLAARTMGEGQRAGEFPCPDCADRGPEGSRDCDSCEGTGKGDDRSRSGWFVAPVIITRDTPDASVEASNFAVLSRMLSEVDPKGYDHETHRFGHWGPGWYEIIIVRPETLAAQEVADAAAAMESHPLLSEEDHSEREAEALDEAWGYYLASDIRREVARITLNIVRIDDVDDDAIASAFGDYVEMESDGARCRVSAFLGYDVLARMRTLEKMLCLEGATLMGEPIGGFHIDKRGERTAPILSRKMRKMVRLAATPKGGR